MHITIQYDYIVLYEKNNIEIIIILSRGRNLSIYII